jgi:hypothetical protein
MKKDITELSDEEVEEKLNRLRAFLNSRWHEENALSEEVLKRKVLKAIKFINKIKWKTRIASPSFFGNPGINLWLEADDRYAPDEFTNVFHNYHDTIYLDTIIGINVRLATNDGDLTITGDAEEMMKFIKQYDIPIDSIEKDLEGYRNNFLKQLKIVDDLISNITGIHPIES